MPRGGIRPGAGRKRGSLTRRTQEIAESAVAAGYTPLDYMLQAMRDDSVAPERRDRMAVAAAPYCHSKPIAAQEMVFPASIDIAQLSDQQLFELLKCLDRKLSDAKTGEDSTVQVTRRLRKSEDSR